MQNIIQISMAAARVNANLTQDEVAKAMKISKNTLVKWEQGKTEPRIDQAIQLSKLYRLPIDYIRFNHEDCDNSISD